MRISDWVSGVGSSVLAEQAGGSQRDAFAEPEPARLACDELAGQVVAAGLGTGGDGVGCHALPARHAGIDALFQYSLANVGAHMPHRDGDVARRFRSHPDTSQTPPLHRPPVGPAHALLLYHSRGCVLV